MMPKIADYTIGWICAITTEYVAAQVFLDGPPHEGFTNLRLNNKNEYTLGSISDHNVVISVLPKGQYGTSTAARVAEDMLGSFPNIRVVLMVGIGGGAPSQKHDIRLGDVVVSTPGDGQGGVFQYDFGKMIQDQSFHPTGFLNQPPTVVCAAVTGLEAQYERKGHQLDKHIDNILKGNSKLLKKYQRPDPASDRLYRTQIVHPEGNNNPCALICGDDPSYLVSRTARTEDDPNPAIHYGLIGSGNTLMKDALVRDKFATEKEVLCFEMEAAGLMNHFPCIVIRGICDYADTHKNDTWQGYAAMVAAAYARDLLYKMAPQKIVQESAIINVVEQERRHSPTKIENHNWYFDIPLDSDLINRMRTSQKRKRTRDYSDCSSRSSDDDRKKARQNHHEKSQSSDEESEENLYEDSVLDDYLFENYVENLKFSEGTRSPTGSTPTLDRFANENSSSEHQLDEVSQEFPQEPEDPLGYPFDSTGSDENSVSSSDFSQY
jgi:nucleoside phosphorylase